MSKSRLEKFLYALYSLDSSDLPNPLSRIEELYKCLVTGEETPTFEPLSRVEKYLMAILGAYNVNELPNPLSRVEVLLYKLATDDDNLDDIKSFLSEHEELLAEIIRNGGVGGNIDIEYVLYTLSTEFNTLYNTEEKPVKSAILKGNTLVNLIDNPNKNITSHWGSLQLLNNLKTNTIYTIVIESPVVQVGVFTLAPEAVIKTYTNGKFVFNSGDNTTLRLYIRHQDNSSSSPLPNEYWKVVVCEGDHTNDDIPYFEGMQSVKMPVLTTVGKNLFDPNKVELVEYGANTPQTVTYDSVTDTYEFLCPTSANQMVIYLRNLYGITSPEQLYITGTYECEDVTYDVDRRVTVDDNEISIKIIHNWRPVTKANLKIMITGDNTAITTAYEPFKTNILTVNEDVELRGIGEVKDELDLLTGEVTERVGEIVLDGSENWKAFSTQNGTYRYATTDKTNNVLSPSSDSILIKAISDKLPIVSASSTWKNIIGICNHKGNGWCIYEGNHNDLASFKEWLSENPITVQYELSQESIKTVDLSVVDQDGNNTKLSTFDDITHVTLSSEGLIPEAELEVATKNEEVLNTMGLEMDDISTTQNALKETSNTQSENVDATMIATTEIYEGLL